MHPKGNISELLLEQGLAKIVDWSFGNVTVGRDKLRAAESAAKAKKLRLWTDFKETVRTAIQDQDFSCVVEEVQSGECLLVNHNNISKKIFLARCSVFSSLGSLPFLLIIFDSLNPIFL